MIDKKTESKREPLIKVTGLWSQKAGDGREYFSGVCKEGEFKGYKFMVFQNTYFREGNRQPQFNLTAAKWVPVSYDDGGEEDAGSD